MDVPDSSIAVYWYARNCKRSEIILKGKDCSLVKCFRGGESKPYHIHCPDMEIIDDDAERANIQFVKINDKRLGKSFGIKKFPALTMIRFS